MKVIDGPVLSEGVLMRLVEFPDGFGRVEVKKPGEDWTPGGDVASVMLGSPVTPEILRPVRVKENPAEAGFKLPRL